MRRQIQTTHQSHEDGTDHVTTPGCGDKGLAGELSCNGGIAPAPTDKRTADTKPVPDVHSIQSYVFTGLRLALGIVFLYASYDKILHPQAFAQAVFNYQILPDVAVNLVALVLSWLELFLGLCLVIGLWLPGATVISSGLLAIFIGALVFNQIRGLDIHCGCFSTETTAGAADFWTVARDLAFLCISVYLAVVVLLPRQSDAESKHSDLKLQAGR